MLSRPKHLVMMTDEGKLGKVRKNHKCYTSGMPILKGGWCEISKILPNSSTGNFLDLVKPKTYYFCHKCSECTH